MEKKNYIGSLLAHFAYIEKGENYIIVSTEESGPLKGVDNNHGKWESFWLEDALNGLTIQKTVDTNSSCSCVFKDVKYQTHVHELLHQNLFGRLRHVKDNTNIMWPIKDSRKGEKLRWRLLENYENSVMTEGPQWDMIQDYENY